MGVGVPLCLPIMPDATVPESPITLQRLLKNEHKVETSSAYLCT